jgi:UDP-2,4-diacetamido-2,4,6-trideoxy-beta-L-altropyranose hydrolase
LQFINKKKTYRIAFRLNAGHHFGMGHVVRCLAIAHELNKKIFVNILFIVNNSPEILFLIQKEGFEVKTYSHNETDEVCNILYQYEPDIIINDLPHSSTDYMKRIKKICPSINYDDGGEGCIYADYLIHVTYKTRTEFVDRKGYLYGVDYLILRDEFFLYRQKVSYKRIQKDPLNILMMMGGSDPANLTVKALEDIQNIGKDLDIDIIIGAGYHNQTQLQNVIRKSKHNIFIYTNVDADELLKLMTQADIGIAHYGITAYEMACVGLPFVAIAHNSEELNENRLSEYGFCLNAGLCDSLKEGDISSCITILLNNKSICEQLSKKGMDTIDANGLIRLVNLIIDVIGEK